MANFGISGIETRILLAVDCNELALLKIGYSKIRQRAHIVNLFVM
jgi:hypothetical protein